MTAAEIASMIAHGRSILPGQLILELSAALDDDALRCTVDVSPYRNLAQAEWTIDGCLPATIVIRGMVKRTVSGSIDLHSVDEVEATFKHGEFRWPGRDFTGVVDVLLTRTADDVEEQFPLPGDADLDAVTFGDRRAS